MESDSAREPEPASLLAPFSVDLFVKHSGWVGLSQILKSRGGSYGLSGPRGAGKTWVMECAIEQANEKDGLGVWFPSPSEYEPVAFLAALSDVVAAEFEAVYDERTGRPTKAARSRFLIRYAAGAALAYLALVLLATTNAGGSELVLPAFITAPNFVLLLLASAGLYIAWSAFRRRREDREGLGRVRDRAEELRRQVRFTVTTTESDEIDVGGKHGGLGAMLKRARERRLVERPATLSSLVHNFRAFVRLIAKEMDGTVVIAIDELDKMSDAARVAQLLRDIKGIFEIPGVCFLVSLSDEAAQAFDLGAVRARDEFNSSFYTVISMPPFTPAEGLELLRLRNRAFDADRGLAIGVLTAGIGRELVRVAELVRLEVGDTAPLDDAIGAAMDVELAAFSSWTLHRGSIRGRFSALGDGARIALVDSIERARVALRDDADALSSALVTEWDLNAGNSIWEEQFAEEWRRLLVRLVLAARIVQSPELIRTHQDAERLQRIVAISSISAAVGRRLLEADAGRVPVVFEEPVAEETR
jgi:KAP-like P-loop domain-containing protein